MQGARGAVTPVLVAVLGVVALGLVAYGVYMLVQARFPILRGV